MTNFTINCLLEDLITLFDSAVGCVPVQRSPWLSHSVVDSLTRWSRGCLTHTQGLDAWEYPHTHVRKTTHTARSQGFFFFVSNVRSCSDFEVKRYPVAYLIRIWITGWFWIPRWCVKTGLSWWSYCLSRSSAPPHLLSWRQIFIKTQYESLFFEGLRCLFVLERQWRGARLVSDCVCVCGQACRRWHVCQHLRSTHTGGLIMTLPKWAVCSDTPLAESHSGQT